MARRTQACEAFRLTYPLESQNAFHALRNSLSNSIVSFSWARSFNTRPAAAATTDRSRATDHASASGRADKRRPLGSRR